MRLVVFITMAALLFVLLLDKASQGVSLPWRDADFACIHFKDQLAQDAKMPTQEEWDKLHDFNQRIILESQSLYKACDALVDYKDHKIPYPVKGN
jgi:hypothetical protein